MAAVMVVKDGHQTGQDSSDHITKFPPVKHGQSSSTNRIIQARGHLSTNLRERAIKAPVTWSRSNTDLGPKDQRRETVSPGFINHSEISPGGAKRRHYLTQHYSYNHLSEAGSSLLSSGKTRSRLPSSKKAVQYEKPGEWTQQLTLGELRKFLNTQDGKLSTRDKDMVPPIQSDMKINIKNTSEQYPNISVTMKNNPRHRLIASNQPLTKSYQHLTEQARPTLEGLEFVPKVLKLPGATTQTEPTLNQHFKSLGKADPDAWTKRWIEENPLGPEINPEYEQDLKKGTTRKISQSSEVSSNGPKSPKRVQFEDN